LMNVGIFRDVNGVNVQQKGAKKFLRVEAVQQ